MRLTRQDGVVASVLGAGRFSVLLSGGQSIGARLSKRFGLLNSRLLVGDRVLVGLLPSAAGNGLIITGAKHGARVGH